MKTLKISRAQNIKNKRIDFPDASCSFESNFAERLAQRQAALWLAALLVPLPHSCRRQDGKRCSEPASLRLSLSIACGLLSKLMTFSGKKSTLDRTFPRILCPTSNILSVLATRKSRLSAACCAADDGNCLAEGLLRGFDWNYSRRLPHAFSNYFLKSSVSPLRQHI